MSWKRSEGPQLSITARVCGAPATCGPPVRSPSPGASESGSAEIREHGSAWHTAVPGAGSARSWGAPSEHGGTRGAGAPESGMSGVGERREPLGAGRRRRLDDEWNRVRHGWGVPDSASGTIAAGDRENFVRRPGGRAASGAVSGGSVPGTAPITGGGQRAGSPPTGWPDSGESRGRGRAGVPPPRAGCPLHAGLPSSFRESSGSTAVWSNLPTGVRPVWLVGHA